MKLGELNCSGGFYTEAENSIVYDNNVLYVFLSNKVFKYLKSHLSNKMSSQQFISNNNQSLLWKVINNTPQTINYFNNAPAGEKEKWFQATIGQVYNQHIGQNISLRDMNKRAIDFMLRTLSNALYKPPGDKPRGEYTQSGESNKQYDYTHGDKPRGEYTQQQPVSMTDQFNRRQAEYDSMIKKEVPTPHFTENVKDEAILDLNSVVEAYKRNRNEDVDIIIPSSNLVTPNLVTPNLVTQKTLLNLNDTKPISLTIEELPKKVVQWGENIEHVFDNNSSIIENKIINIERGIEELKSKLNDILSILQKSS